MDDCSGESLMEFRNIIKMDDSDCRSISSENIGLIVPRCEIRNYGRLDYVICF